MQPEELIRTLIEDVFNRGNLSKLDTIIHPEYRYTSPDSQLHGIDQLKEFVQTFRRAFPDLTLQIDDFFISGDRSCTTFTLRGTHEENFMGIPATKKSVQVQGMVMSRFKHGKISEDWEILDNLSLLQQLGVIPQMS